MPGYESAPTPERNASRSSKQSAELRKRGNTYFLQAREEASDSDKQHSLLKLALGLYQKALDAAAEEEDLASAHKNLAATLAHMAQCVTVSGASSSSSVLGEAVELLQQAVQHRCSAFLRGQSAELAEKWVDESWASLGCAVHQLVELLSSAVGARPSQVASAVHQLDVLRTLVPEELHSWVVIGMSTFLFRVKDTAAALMAPTVGRGGAPFGGGGEPDWRSCLLLLAESKRPLIEAIEMAIDCEEDECVNDLLQLEDALWLLACRAESTQARLQGDQMLHRVLQAAAQASMKTSEPPSSEPQGEHEQQQEQQEQQEQVSSEVLDGVLSAIDLFKSAALLAREKDLQAEAQALSRLGHTYKVCADMLNPTLNRDPLVSRSAEERSRAAFLQVLGLVDSLPHRISLMMEPWYREARDAISEYQRTTAAEETARKEREQAPIREELKEELTALYAAADKGWVELLKHAYTQHPPLNPANRVTDFSGFTVETGKEVLRKAILAYHPDKQNAHPGSTPQWQVLAEEITKSLTRKYEVFK